MKTINHAASKDSSEAIQKAYEQLKEALENIHANESWLDYLAFQSKFYDYSFNNTLLIYSQKPDASYVSGYKQWQSFNRYVKRGELGIKIFAPIKYKVKDESGDEFLRLTGFKLVSVFDISQTDGSDEFLPVLVSGLKKTFEGETEIYSKLKDIVDIPIQEVDQFAAKGCYYLTDPHIEIRSSLSALQKIKTLCHEYSHHLHHTKYHEDETYDLGEVIAKSSAYIVCKYLGIDTADYSVGYVKNWARDSKVLQSVASKVQKISADIINLMNESPSCSSSTELSNGDFLC